MPVTKNVFYFNLVNKQRYFLNKTSRLKSRKQIDMLFGKGNQFSNFPFKIIWLPQNNVSALQVGIGVSSKSFKKAVDRNRIKRLIRESWRLQKNTLQQQLQAGNKQLSVFILYTHKELPEYTFVFEKISQVLERLIKIADANH
ncbi:MAG: ribonuclease P protein component [Bacteroidetes bacterium]|nr:ribonuclease P protein component [Bacteroidota bacterium]MBS1756495.1 ribonuclease P protein component [Bacteroidota bacterium]